jgi:acyl-CoA synthetase (AMP-forming)/AMP-acid ligase II
MTAETLAGLLRSQCDQRGGQVAYSFLTDGEADQFSLTYADLDREARRVAVAVGERVAPGGRAVLVYPPGPAFVVAFFGCLYAGVAAVPVFPPVPPRFEAGAEHLRRVIADVGAEAVLCTSDLLGLRDYLGDGGSTGTGWLATDVLGDISPDDWHDLSLDGDSVAFIQYTSGSTSAPKGVILRHHHLIANQRAITDAFGLSSATIGLSWLPTYHDMGLIGFVIVPMAIGITSYFLSPLHFLERPARWLEAISRFGATVSGGPNFAYELCARRISDEELGRIDLTTWEVAFVGSEPVRPDTMRRFARRFAAAGLSPAALFPCYGMAEASLLVAGGSWPGGPATARLDADALSEGRVLRAGHRPGKDAGRETEVASVGRVITGHDAAITDPATHRPAGPGQVGEIWLRGPSIAAGYWGRAAETIATFGATIEGGDGRPYLRTGDLGFVLDGELFITGRMKEVVILRGQNVYPQDIERAIQEADPRFRPGCGAAFGIGAEGTEGLVVVQETKAEDQQELADLSERARRAVAVSHGVRLEALLLVAPRTLAKTSSGKVQRLNCRSAYLGGTLSPLHEWRAAPLPAREQER